MAAAAQPSPPPKNIETVIVNGEKTPDDVAHDYLQKRVQPAPFLGKLARWNARNPLCPSAAGFSAENAAYIVGRIRQIAAEAGAPVNKNLNCKANMAVIATTVPQGLLQDIRAHRSDLLGYFSSPSQADRLAVMKYPIQGFYETATIDANGNAVRDMINNPACPPPAEYCSVASSGGRARDDMESAFFEVTIIVDARDIPDHPLSALADYLAMMALAQTGDATPCQDTPSITSLLSRDCPSGGLAQTATATDIAFLKGLYEMDGGMSTAIQRGTIAREVTKSLGGR